MNFITIYDFFFKVSSSYKLNLTLSRTSNPLQHIIFQLNTGHKGIAVWKCVSSRLAWEQDPRPYHFKTLLFLAVKKEFFSSVRAQLCWAHYVFLLVPAFSFAVPSLRSLTLWSTNHSFVVIKYLAEWASLLGLQL